MRLVLLHCPPIEIDDIISYHDVMTAEKALLQKGMNYGVGKKYSVFLMSLRENAPYGGSDLFYGACLKKYGTSMMREKEFLTS
jgi:hypothetical protein